MNESPRRFDDLMLRRERIFGFIWLPVHIILLPVVLVPILVLLFGADKFTEAGVNVLYYCISFLAVLIAFWNFLRESFSRFVERLGRAVIVMLTAYGIQLALTLLLQLFMGFFGELDTPNNDAIDELADLEFNKMFAAVVLMAPIVEEVLFRGVLFGSLARRHRVLAWVVSVTVFCLYHVWQFAVVEQDWAVLITAIEYIPLTVAITYCYDRSQTIWTPIFFHMLTNTLALTFMTAG